jgi:hypothetical protein
MSHKMSQKSFLFQGFFNKSVIFQCVFDAYLSATPIFINPLTARGKYTSAEKFLFSEDQKPK